MFLFRKGFIDGWLGRPKGTDTIRYPRRATRRTATVLWAGHSLVQTAYGNPIGANGAVDPFGGILDVNWPSGALSDYVSYGSMEAVRDLSGHLLNSDYNAVIVSEFTDPGGSGYPALDSASGRNTLQQAYWDGLNAAERGAELILQDVWSPAGSDLDSNVRGFFQGLREWLQLHLGRPVWIIPANPFVAALRNAYGNAIYEDGLHLGRSSAYARGMSYLVYSFLRQERCPFVVAGDEAIDQLAWDTLMTYECAGMGGATAYASAMPGTDPLPGPLPLPTPAPIPPDNATAPIITGTAQVGQELASSAGIWSGDLPMTFEFRWISASEITGIWSVIEGATAETYIAQPAQEGLYIRSQVRATNAGGDSGWIASASAGPITAAPPVLTAPSRASAPGVIGTLQVGETLSVDPAAVYSGNPAPTINYRWQMRPAGGGTITTLTTASQLQLALAQQDMQIRLQDMASNSQGSTGWASGAWSTPVAAPPVEPAGLEDMETTRILFVGNSMTDSLFSGSADVRQTLGKSHATGPTRFRKFTIPGSTQGITWDQRFGAPGGAAGAAAPYNSADAQSVAYPGRDMARFDAVCWSSAGPFPQLPDPDFNNEVYRDERDHFRLWSQLCDTNGVRKYFLTFPPATDWLTFNQPSGWPALADPDVYERYLTSQRLTAEEWVAEVDPSITIIPKTELWREIHRRCVAGTFPGVSNGSTTPVLQNDPPEMGLVIHPTHLGSIFEAVFVWRFLHGAHMADERIADMLDDGSYAVTVAQIKKIVDSSLAGYVQGSGFGIKAPSGWTRPAPYADFSNLSATVPALAITGNPAGFLTAGNHALGDLTGPVEFYALLDIEFATGSGEIAPLIAFYEDQGGIWDAKYIGVTVHNGINGLFVRYLGQSKTQAFTPGARQVWEFIATPTELHLHMISPQESQSSPNAHATPVSAAHRFGINAHEWTDGSLMIPETFAAAHRIHGGLVYRSVPDAAERLRLQTLLAGAYT